MVSFLPQGCEPELQGVKACLAGEEQAAVPKGGGQARWSGVAEIPQASAG